VKRASLWPVPFPSTTLLRIAVFALATWSSLAAAAPSEADKERALALYEQGKSHYDLGEYDAAIARFKAAYEISEAPLLIFNIAQSYRLKGDCPRALDGYRHFVRLDPASSLNSEAQGHIRSLVTVCPAAEPARPSAAPAAPAASVSTSLPAATSGPGRRTSLVLLGSGAALLASGVAIGIWNHRRYGRWSDEDRRLSLPPPGGDAQAQEWIDRQNRNDDLYSSVRRTNYATVSLGVTSLACLLASAWLWNPRWD
jgi:tetratricopeptide (TPR) repeat protein